jgi:threonine/homoserine/homoserine lactone efflux protein
MGEVLGHLLPIAVAIAAFPVPIIAVVLMLAGPRGAVNGPAFALGWVLGLAVVGAVVVLVAGERAHDDSGAPSGWVSALWLVIGIALVVLGVRQFRGRPTGGVPAEMPGWMRAIEGFRWPRAMGAGLALSAANPKNLLLVVGGASIIAEADLAGAQVALALALFVLVASAGVLTPVALRLALGARAAPLLEALRGWLVANNAVIMAVLLIVIGALILGDAIAGFSA